MKKLSGIYILSFTLLAVVSAAQVNVVHFERMDYNAGAQNWAMHQDVSGIMYIANNEGLLTFDGARWNLWPLPNKTILRSLVADGKGRIYAGGQDELGYFAPDATGKLQYRSLLPLVPERYRQFSDVWHIVLQGNDVFFQSFTTLFRLNNGKIQAYPAPGRWEYLGAWQGKVYALEKKAGLLSYGSKGWDTLAKAAQLPADFSITAVAAHRGQPIFTTALHGIWQLNKGVLQPNPLLNARIEGRQHYTAAQALPKGQLLLGTYQGGVYHIDSTGNLLRHYNRSNALINNNIKCIFSDGSGHVWLGLDDGITLLDLESPVQHFNPALFNDAPGYAALRHNNQLYLALGSGLFTVPIASILGSQTSVAGLQKIEDGLTWNVMKAGNKIMVGKDDGLYELSNGRLQAIDRSAGYWNLKYSGKRGDTTIYTGGQYFGISYFAEKNGSLTKIGNQPNFSTSARFLEYDSARQNIWVSHPYRGIYSIHTPSQAVKFFAEKEGLPSQLNNHIYKINNKVLATTEQGVYAFNAQDNAFERTQEFFKLLSNQQLRYLSPDEQSNIWLVKDKTPGILDASKKAIYFFPELQRKIKSGFEHIYPLDSSHVLIGGEQGFYIVNYTNYLQKKEVPRVFIRQVSAQVEKDTILRGCYASPDEAAGKLQLPHYSRELLFSYAVPYNLQNHFVEFSYRLRGLNNTWSSWSQRTERSISALPPGGYVFEVKARNNLYAESELAAIAFEILPPWYKTLWARLLYAIAFITGIWALLRWQEAKIKQRHKRKMAEAQARFDEEQKILAYKHQLQLEQAEKERIQLHNEKLEAELAATAMNLVQKKEFLQKMRDEINKIKNKAKEGIDPTDLKKIVKDLTADDKLDEEWDQFSIHFNNVHNNFLKTLKNKFPQLSAHDLKLCAYLRMNLSSKEMARLMNISVRGVEINRYRLRKKLQLEPKESLFDFFVNVENENLDTSSEGTTTAP